MPGFKINKTLRNDNLSCYSYAMATNLFRVPPPPPPRPSLPELSRGVYLSVIPNSEHMLRQRCQRLTKCYGFSKIFRQYEGTYFF